MKKLTKRILSLALAVLMAASLASVAFAAGTDYTFASFSTNVTGSDHSFTAYYSPDYSTATFTATDVTGTTALAVWATSGANVAAFDASGMASETTSMTNDVYLRSDGNTTISVSSSVLGKNGNFNLVVAQDMVIGVSITGGDRTIAYGDDPTLSAVVTYEHGTGSTVHWSSNSTSVATIDENTGKVTCTGVGEATIVATSSCAASTGGSNTASIKLTVTPAVHISGTTSFDENQSTALTATIVPKGSYTYGWTSGNNLIIVSATGNPAMVTAPAISQTETAKVTCTVSSGGTEVALTA